MRPWCGAFLAEHVLFAEGGAPATKASEAERALLLSVTCSASRRVYPFAFLACGALRSKKNRSQRAVHHSIDSVEALRRGVPAKGLLPKPPKSGEAVHKTFAGNRRKAVSGARLRRACAPFPPRLPLGTGARSFPIYGALLGGSAARALLRSGGGFPPPVTFRVNRGGFGKGR